MKRLLCIMLFLALTVAACGETAQAPTQIATTPTAQAATQAAITPTPKWATIHTFTGHLHNKTPFFTVTKGWRLSWSCTNSTVPSGATGAVGITAYDQAGRTLSGNSDNPTVAMGRCPPQDAPTTGISVPQQYGGSLYLDVYATGDWSLQVQEMK